eukprot:6413710-Prymnesium_polylepis.1
MSTLGRARAAGAPRLPGVPLPHHRRVAAALPRLQRRHARRPLPAVARRAAWPEPPGHRCREHRRRCHRRAAAAPACGVAAAAAVARDCRGARRGAPNI